MSDVSSDNDELPEDVRSLLDGERNDVPAPSAAREMVLDRVFSTVGLAPAPHPAQPTQPPPPVVPTTAGSATAVAGATAGWTGALAVGAAVVALVAGSLAVRSRAHSVDAHSVAARPAATVVSVPMATRPTVPPVPRALPSPALAPRASQTTTASVARTAASGTRRASAAVDDGPEALEEEQRLLGAAQRSLTQRDADGALSSVRAHARRFPRGTLAEERDALEVRALLLARREDEARALAARFRRRYPDSVFIATIDARLGEPR